MVKKKSGAQETEEVPDSCSVPMLFGPCGRTSIEASGKCLLHSEDSQKNTNLFWEEIERTLCSPQLDKAEKPWCDFTLAIFPGGRFPAAVTSKILGTAFFRGARFTGRMSFWTIEFCQGAIFESALFQGSASFGASVFRETADFTHTRFEDTVIFSSAIFWCDASFVDTTFHKDTYFRFTSFLPEGRNRLPVVADFTGASFLDPSRVELLSINNRRDWDWRDKQGFRVRFLHCDVSGIHLENLNWNRRLSWWESFLGNLNFFRGFGRLTAGRIVLEDEVDVQKGDYEYVATIYRQLMQNFELGRFDELAEEAFCGSMDMRLQDPNRPMAMRFVLALYGYASMYGSSYSRALIVLLGMIVVFSALFLCAGLSNPETGRILDYNFFPSLPSLNSIGDFLDALHFTIAILLRTPRGFEPMNRLGEWLTALATLLLTTELALLILALRRRLKR